MVEVAARAVIIDIEAAISKPESNNRRMVLNIIYLMESVLIKDIVSPLGLNARVRRMILFVKCRSRYRCTLLTSAT